VYNEAIKGLSEKLAIPEGSSVEEAEGLGREANKARNDALDQARDKLSDSGKDFSKALKERGYSWQDLADRYAKDLGKDYGELSDAEKIEVNERIVKGSSKSNTEVN
jgi:hypothetical protein